MESTVPPVTEEPTLTTRVKTALPAASDGLEHETMPPAPTAGVVHDHPPGEASDTKVVPAGNVSESKAVAALLGPPLVTVMV